MTYEKLFQIIQNSRDYRTDSEGLGTDWKYYEEEGKTYLLFQETKNDEESKFRDWFFNFLFIPCPFFFRGHILWFPLGAVIQAKTSFKYIAYDIKYGTFSIKDNKLISTGWSAGGISAIITALMLLKKYSLDIKVITYGTPACCFTKKTIKVIEEAVTYWRDYLHQRDWIGYFIPFYKRKATLTVVPRFEPHTLDERHRVYGKAMYNPEEII